MNTSTGFLSKAIIAAGTLMACSLACAQSDFFTRSTWTSLLRGMDVESGSPELIDEADGLSVTVIETQSGGLVANASVGDMVQTVPENGELTLIEARYRSIAAGNFDDNSFDTEYVIMTPITEDIVAISSFESFNESTITAGVPRDPGNTLFTVYANIVIAVRDDVTLPAPNLSDWSGTYQVRAIDWTSDFPLAVSEGTIEVTITPLGGNQYSLDAGDGEVDTFTLTNGRLEFTDTVGSTYLFKLTDDLLYFIQMDATGTQNNFSNVEASSGFSVQGLDGALSSARTEPAIGVSFFAFPGSTYQIQRTDDLAGGSWENVGTPVSGGSGLVERIFFPDDAKRFFRVVATPETASD